MPSEWNNERLDRLASSSEANRLQIERNTANIADLITGIGELLKAVENQHQDIRGLQLEVRRLVEELRERRGE